MKKKLVVIAIILISLSRVSLAQSVADILTKHVEAMGGTEKLNNFKTLKMSASFQISGMDVMQNTTVVNNKAFRQEVSIQGMNIIQVVEGNKGWSINPLMGQKDPVPLQDDMVGATKDQMDLTGSLVNSKEKGNTVELIGNEKIGSSDTYKLKITKKDGAIDYYYLDQKTYLPVRAVSSRKVQGQEFKQEVNTSNYQAVDGIQFPFTMSIKSDVMPGGGPMVVTVKTIQVNPEVNEDIFKAPVKK